MGLVSSMKKLGYLVNLMFYLLYLNDQALDDIADGDILVIQVCQPIRKHPSHVQHLVRPFRHCYNAGRNLVLSQAKGKTLPEI